jgi:bacteriorhodopsin
VLLIHLSNLAGKEVFNVRRMMKILVAYQILMCSGSTASMMDDGYRWIFYFNG